MDRSYFCDQGLGCTGCSNAIAGAGVEIMSNLIYFYVVGAKVGMNYGLSMELVSFLHSGLVVFLCDR